MRELFDDTIRSEPLDPVDAARRSLRTHLRKRFYEVVDVAEGEGGFGLLLDNRPVRTPARRLLAAPARGLAEAVAAEWRAQSDHIDPARMPLTRLANSVIDGVVDAPGAVAAEVEKYLASDLLFYRATSPDGLVVRQSRAWDPVIDWARDTLGARFVLSQALVFVAQPEAALMAGRAAIPRDALRPNDVWRLGALHSITTLTGSALLALAHMRGRLAVEEAWAAAHVDEDWNMEQWGRDELALERRASRFAEMQAAAAVLHHVGL